MLLSLTVFMLLVAEIMPATSDSVPLIGKRGPEGAQQVLCRRGDPPSPVSVALASARHVRAGGQPCGRACRADSPLPPRRPHPPRLVAEPRFYRWRRVIAAHVVSPESC